MEIFDYINSGDIKKHLRSIDYKLNSVEAAFIVWQSKTHTMKQKHEAFNFIIDNMPDCPLNKKYCSADNRMSEYNTLRWTDTDKAKYISIKVLDNGDVLNVNDENCTFIKDFMIAYRIILGEENINSQRKYLGITDKGLCLAGLKNDYLSDFIYDSLKDTVSGGLCTIAARPAMGNSNEGEAK